LQGKPRVDSVTTADALPAGAPRPRDGSSVRSSPTSVRQLWRSIATRRDRPDLELLAADDDLMLFRVTDRIAAAP
jgi:hypothetical protein